MSETAESGTAQVPSMDIQQPGGSGGTECCACCTPNCKNGLSLVAEIFGITGFVFNLTMFAEIDDILKCVFTSVIYFIGIILSILFFVATVSRLCGYKGFFNAHPIWRASMYLHACCCGDGCEGMTSYREGAFQDSHALAYIFLSVLIPGELIPLAASYLDNIRGYVKAVGLKIDHPAVLWLVIVGRPLVALAQVIYAGYNVYAKDRCSYLFKSLVALGIFYIVVLAVLYGVSFGDVIDCACPQFFNKTTMCKTTSG